MTTETINFNSSALGVHQSDVIVRTGLIQALRDLRADPSLLDHVFSDASDAARAKVWFLKHDIPVVMIPRLDEAQMPCVTIALAASNESEVTLGDVHYESSEPNDSVWPPLTPEFAVEETDPGIENLVRIPQGIADLLILAPGMVLIDPQGRETVIEDVFEDNWVQVSTLTDIDLGRAVIKGLRPAYNLSLESVVYKETYQIGVHVSGEPAYLRWLYSIVAFALLRSKQAYLEARGFERSVFSAADFDRNQIFTTESVYSRYLSLSGYVRNYWPKHFVPVVSALQVEVTPEITESTSDQASSRTPLGIFQSELALRDGIVAGIRDLRANPWLLDYAFLTLRTDELTRGQYEGELELAKKWFQSTDIPVLLAPVLDKPRLPCITIKLLNSSESEVTLGDIHYQSTELDYDAPWPAIGPAFTPIGFDPQTGIVRLSETTLAQVPVAEGLFVVDQEGREFEIQEVYNDESFRIIPVSGMNLRGAVIKGRRPSVVKHLESAWYRDNFQVGVHVSGEPVYLTWLHSILTFLLLRYKETLLEAVGVERTMFNSSDFSRDEEFGSELVFTRYMDVTGYVRQYWPKETTSRVETTRGAIKAIGGDRLPEIDPNIAMWVGENDDV